MGLYYMYYFVTFFSTWQYFMFSFQRQHTQFYTIFNDYTATLWVNILKFI